jgi:AraC family transcriptional regulator
MDTLMSDKKSFTIKLSYIIVPLLFAIGFFAAYMMTYLGAFKPVVISEKKAGPFQMIYKTHIGPYHKIVPRIEEVENWAKTQNIDCRFSFGEYLDNPENTEEVRLRSHGGCIFQDLPAVFENLVVPEGFEKKTLPERHYVTAIFEGSPGIGPLKVYPKILAYIEDQRLIKDESILEIYEIHSQKAMTTTYYFPIKNPTAPKQ